ncbi:MAG TPA: allantoicase [Candidatus Limnocylindria bacterium]|nr:allantoicase [Candidatus Limnocylindria bacterium]
MKDFTKLVDLASARLGGKAVAANDDFFAPKENLLKPSKPIFIEGKYTSRGKWMDGWETRRRRTPGCDWCIIRLGLRGIIRGVVVDTSHFKGNYPSHFSIEGCDWGLSAPYKNEKKRLRDSKTCWVEIVPQTALQGDTLNQFSVAHASTFTHLRLKIYPDGGVARLRVHGEVVPEKVLHSRGEFDLVAVENGGSVLVSSDEFFSAPLNLLMPGRGKDMSDGWETRRRRGPGHDWVILRLGVPGVIRRVEVDTAHFKGNYPDRCSIESCCVEDSAKGDSSLVSAAWRVVLPETKLKANHRHFFSRQLEPTASATHVRFSIFPDGGVSRLRIFGLAEHLGGHLRGIERFNRLSATRARKSLFDCCSSMKWAEQMSAQRPFSNAAALLEASDKIWAALGRREWLTAFRHHPAIGAKRANRKQTETARRWSAGEQSMAQQSSPDTLAALTVANRAYHSKFGHVFIICASGKSSEQILKNLQERMSNEPEVELRNAAEEQRKITRLRLEKLLES